MLVYTMVNKNQVFKGVSQPSGMGPPLGLGGQRGQKPYCGRVPRSQVRQAGQ